jgi:uncharacterized protein (DUF1778 family)
MATSSALPKKRLNVETTSEQYEEIKSFAAFNGQSISSFVLSAVFEKIEDWEDIRTAEEYRRLEAAGEITTIPFETVMEELGDEL